MKVFLIGYMGCGKSTLGKGLASQLGVAFIDLDTYIEERYHSTIPILFHKYGEESFRQLESSCLKEVCADTNSCVVATGGGTPCYIGGMDIMNKSGITIYIDMSAGMLVSRLLEAKRKRPLIEGKNKEELAAYVDMMLELRLPYYRRAMVTVDGRGLSAKALFNILKYSMSYRYKRRETDIVTVGGVAIGGDNSVVIQSMGSVSTNEIDAASDEALSIAQSGALLVRYTAQGVREAENLARIKCRLIERGCSVPLVADIHFNPEAAFVAATTVDKVRINPGNFSSEEHLRERLMRLISICNEYGTALRIGVNNGSLSTRMVERYGDTVEGMVASAMEYLRLCRELEFDRVVVSLKSSSSVIMVRAYRELVTAMDKEGFKCPLHLGVTEAGNGMEGRSRSAVGIGALLSEGIGDTVRVSLTERAENESPFAAMIIDYVETHIVNDYCDEGFVSSANSGSISVPIVTFGDDISYQEVDYSSMRSISTDKPYIVINEPSFHCRRVAVEWVTKHFKGSKVVVKRCYSLERDQFIAALGVDFGSLLLDGYCDALWIENELLDKEEVGKIVLDILQASRRRISAPEYISCPSCGRTLYDIESVLGEVKRRTRGVKNIKIAVMGCIVNGPGEMADADYGYVGAGVGCVTLYKSGEIYKRNIPQESAIDELVALLEENNEFEI